MINGTCETRPGGFCYSSVEEVNDESSDDNGPNRAYGCMPPEQSGGLLMCKVSLVPELHGKNIVCCDTSDYCNFEVHPPFKRRTTTTPKPGTDDDQEFPFVALMISIIVCGALCLTVIGAMYFVYKRKERRTSSMKKLPRDASCLIDPHRRQHMPNHHHSNQLSEFGGSGDFSSGSGAGLPLLVQRTIVREIERTELIGQGRYGKVYLARFRGENVAAKVFYPAAEASWTRESEIYQSVVMRHENIMGFIAADIDGNGQRTLITHYHELGSLQTFLKGHQLSPKKLYDLAHSLASGLAHLHTEIFGAPGKPAIAHCDITSQTVLVKRDLRCAISDFGMAVKYVSETDEVNVATNSRVASYRYMAPELLNKTLVADKFESYKQCDMYAAGLVFWEMARCCVTPVGRDTKKTVCDEYAVPYHDLVPGELARAEDMRPIVCGDAAAGREGLRPPVPQRWDDEEILRTLKGVMVDCWKENPASRLTSLRVKKTLGKLTDNPDQFVKIDNIRNSNSVAIF